jgi:hypothetical protein
MKIKQISIPGESRRFAHVSQAGNDDLLWGYSDKLFPVHSEIGAWAMLQGVQLVLSILLLKALHDRPADAKPLLVVDTPNQSMKPTARLGNKLSVFAATPCRGLSLSR